MATVISRTFISSPQRDAHETWAAISELLTQGEGGETLAEFEAVGGIAASLIADRIPAESPIVVTSDGPRTRIYCLYDEDAIDGSDANEEPFGFDPLNGAWHVSLPCAEEDLDWVQSALKEHSVRITAREPDETVTKAEPAAESAVALTLNPEKFLTS